MKFLLSVKQSITLIVDRQVSYTPEKLFKKFVATQLLQRHKQ